MQSHVILLFFLYDSIWPGSTTDVQVQKRNPSNWHKNLEKDLCILLDNHTQGRLLFSLPVHCSEFKCKSAYVCADVNEKYFQPSVHSLLMLKGIVAKDICYRRFADSLIAFDSSFFFAFFPDITLKVTLQTWWTLRNNNILRRFWTMQIKYRHP